MRPYYSDDLVTLYHGDALEVMDSLDSGVADIVVTSPPYNMGLTPGGNGRGLYGHTTQHASRFTNDGYDGASDAMPPEEYEQFLRDSLLLCARAADGAVWFNHRPRIWHGRAKLPFDMEFGFLDDLPDFALRQVVIWDRKQGTGTNAGHLTIRQEWVMLFAWAGFKMDRAQTGMGDVWTINPPNDSEHPCPFPEELPARCIRLSSPATVLDPFTGSGTTLLAAKRAGVKAIGVEQSERFCEITAERCGGPVRSVADGFDFAGAALGGTR